MKHLITSFGLVIFALMVCSASSGRPSMLEPNQECGTETAHSTTAPVTGEWSDYYEDQWTAEFKAEDKVEYKLGVESYVECALCPDRIQCRRSVWLDWIDGTLTYTYEQNEEDEWRAKATYSGDYTVRCKSCD